MRVLVERQARYTEDIVIIISFRYLSYERLGGISIHAQGVGDLGNVGRPDRIAFGQPSPYCDQNPGVVGSKQRRYAGEVQNFGDFADGQLRVGRNFTMPVGFSLVSAVLCLTVASVRR